VILNNRNIVTSLKRIPELYFCSQITVKYLKSYLLLERELKNVSNDVSDDLQSFKNSNVI
jgi:hypothetical protein